MSTKYHYLLKDLLEEYQKLEEGERIISFRKNEVHLLIQETKQALKEIKRLSS